MPISFIDSPFCSKVEYEAWLKLPAEEQQAALDAKGVDSLTEAAESLAVLYNEHALIPSQVRNGCWTHRL